MLCEKRGGHAPKACEPGEALPLKELLRWLYDSILVHDKRSRAISGRGNDFDYGLSDAIGDKRNSGINPFAVFQAALHGACNIIVGE